MDINGAAAASDLTVDELTNLARIFAMAEHPLAIPGNILSGQADAAGGVSAVQVVKLMAGAVSQPEGLLLSPGSPLAEVVKPASAAVDQGRQLIGRLRAVTGQVMLLLGGAASGAVTARDGDAAAGGR